MLEELRIENFAVIDRLELRFAPGFNVITGETGAGKSILVDAVELLLGGRADADFIRAGASRSLVEGLIRLQPAAQPALMALLRREELLDADAPRLLTLTRELRRGGRSTARVNGSAVRSDILGEIGQALFDIHGQSEHLSLLRARQHIELLDRYAGLLDAREDLARLVARLTAAQAELSALRADSESLRRRADMLRHEVAEIDAAALKPAEESERLAERNRLANSEQLATLAAEAARLLNGDERGAAPGSVDSLMAVANALRKLAGIDPALAADYDAAEGLAAAAQELALTLARYADDIEYDPARLDELEERLELINTLKRRFQLDSAADILAYGERARRELDGIENSDARLHELGAKAERLLMQIGERCAQLSAARARAGQRLSAAVLAELKELRMERARFELRLAQAEHPGGCIVGERRYKFDAKGMDDVEFMLAANPGAPLRPLAKVASGGEAARIMLALKRVLTAADQTPVLIFDEVDQGIGGRLGAVVGQKLWSLSGGHQVLCVTHLPQLAAFADLHFCAEKGLAAAQAATRVRELRDEGERAAELAAMLGTAGHAGARELLQAARVWKGG